MAVSTSAPHRRAKAMAVSTGAPRRRAKATGVSKNRTAWSTGPGRASRRRVQPHISDTAPPVWRAPEGPEGLAAVPVGGGARAHTCPPDWRPPQGLRGNRSVAAALVGGGRARAGLEIDHSERSSRVAISRAGRRPRAHRADTPKNSRPRGGRRSGGGWKSRGRPGPTKHTRRPEHQRRNKHHHRNRNRNRNRKAYSPRNALIAGISRTACTRPAR